MRRFFQVCIIFLLSIVFFKEELLFPASNNANPFICMHKIKPTKQRFAHKAGYFLGDVIMDALRLHRYLFSVTTAQVITGITPFYIISRSIDEDLQSRFYDSTCHKNRNQFSSKCHKVAQHGIGVPMIALSSLALFGWNEDVRTTARVFAIGLPFVHSGKDIIKKIDTKACLRPWHEEFSCKQRSCGGFPSGHMANITYATALFGMRFGLKWAVPLGLFASFVFADFINCNRHYLSQIIAGAGLGLVYAFAANKVIEQKLNERFSVCLTCDPAGRPNLKMAFNF
ncbi:MAG: phosphatase PAP2 family protein [Candidatus Babeliales bacterium]